MSCEKYMCYETNVKNYLMEMQDNMNAHLEIIPPQQPSALKQWHCNATIFSLLNFFLLVRSVVRFNPNGTRLYYCWSCVCAADTSAEVVHVVNSRFGN